MDIKSFNETMKELGFNEDSSFETKKAFLKHLFKQASIKEASASATKKNYIKEHQLSLFEYIEDKAS